jgi:hypothetical protein
MAFHLSARALLLATALPVSFAGAVAPAFAQSTDSSVALDEAFLGGDDWEVQAITPEDKNDTGQTTLDGKDLQQRSTDPDANSALVALPNVHVRSNVTANDTLKTDIGQRSDDVLDTRPQELSISGGLVGENKVTIDGVSVNSSVLPRENVKLGESEEPAMTSVYGVHSQSQYIPGSLVESTEVLDSNISAEHGGFQGGVVNYELRKAELGVTRGSASLSYQNQDFAKYSLATEDGDNPDDVKKPTWSKLAYSVDYNMALNDRTAVLFAHSSTRASAEKDREAQILDGDTVESESTNNFYRLGLTRELGNGGVLTGTVNFTDYKQTFDVVNSRNYHVDVENKSVMGVLNYAQDLGAVAFLDDAKLDLSFSTQRNELLNDSGDKTLLQWGTRTWGGDDLAGSLDWCQGGASAERGSKCIEGGIGSKELNETRYTLAAKIDGGLGNGTFKAGVEANSYDVTNKGSGFAMFGNPAANASGTCSAGDPGCNADQVLGLRATQAAYDNSVDAQSYALFTEVDQTFGNWTLRGGLRADYDTVLENVNIAPRLSATWDLRSDLSLTLGANRYYDDNFLAYAVHDATPQVETRIYVPALDQEFGPYGGGKASYSTGDLKTPYTDEISFAAAYADAWGGNWRLRALKRDGKDQFANEKDAGKNILTNDAESEYKSITLEYASNWTPVKAGVLDGLGFYSSATWSESSRSHNSYFEDGDVAARPILYKGKSYTRSNFGKVTGNLDQPLRGTVAVHSSWMEGGFDLGLSADLTAGYKGVIRDGGQTHEGVYHYVYKDHDFDPYVAVNLAGSARVVKLDQDRELRVDFKVTNLLDRQEEGSATDSNPWVQGRTVWVGSTFDF